MASTSGTSPPLWGPPLWKIYVTMSSESAKSYKAADIPFYEGVQETDPKDLDAEVVEDLVPEDSEASMLKLDGDSDNSKEPPWKAMGKETIQKQGTVGKK